MTCEHDVELALRLVSVEEVVLRSRAVVRGLGDNDHPAVGPLRDALARLDESAPAASEPPAEATGPTGWPTSADGPTGPAPALLTPARVGCLLSALIELANALAHPRDAEAHMTVAAVQLHAARGKPVSARRDAGEDVL